MKRLILILALLTTPPLLQASDIIAGRPRLLLNETRGAGTFLTVLQARKNAPTPEWTAFKNAVDTYAMCTPASTPDCPIGHDFAAKYVQAVALVYQVLANNDYGNRAAYMLNQLALSDIGNLPLAGSIACENYPQYHWADVYPFMAFSFDWVHDRLTTTQKNNTVAFLQRGMEGCTGGGDCCGWGGNYKMGCTRSNIIAAVATFGDYASAQTVFNAAVSDWTTYIKPVLIGTTYPIGPTSDPGMYSGAPYEGWSYGWFLTDQALDIVGAVLSGTGGAQDLRGDIPDFYGNRLDFTIHSTSPTAGGVHGIYEPRAFGDVQINFQNYLLAGNRTSVLRLLDRLGALSTPDTVRQQYARYYLDSIQTTYNQGSEGEDPIYTLTDFMFYDRSVTAADWFSAYPLVYRAVANEKLTFRSAWTSAAVWGGFDSGPTYLNHGHADALQIELYRKGVWLLQEQHAGAPYSTNDGSCSFTRSSIITNSHGAAATGVPGCLGTGSVNGAATMPRYESATNYLYAQADGTLAWQRPSCGAACDATLVLRDFLCLKPGCERLVVIDRVAFDATYGGNKTVWSIANTVGTPAVVGNRITVTATQSGTTQKAFINTFGSGVLAHSPAIDNRAALISKATIDASTTVLWGEFEPAIGQITIDGAPGSSCGIGGTDWCVINGTYTTTWPADSNDYTRFTIPRNTSNITGPFPYGSVRWIEGATAGNRYIYNDTNRMLWGSTGNSNVLMAVIQLADSGDTEMTATRLADSNVLAVTFEDRVVAANSTTSSATAVTLPITYSGFASNATRHHMVVGLTPSTGYVVVTSTPGAIAISTTGTPNHTSTAAGVLEFDTAPSAPPTIKYLRIKKAQ